MKDFAIADLFCGAGGTSEGAVEAIRALGFEPKLTAINHWDVAIATHTANHPDARHLCTSLDNINPRHLFKDGELEVLWASPECTHHSVARGGKPINDQSRATAWCVVRWAEALRPNVILVENVPEFETWGAIGTNGRPLKTKRGATFIAWANALESLGYSVDWRVLCAADYGDPTTRRRLFVQAVRGRRKIVWPDPTHAPKQDTDLLGSRKAWVPARDIIDWSVPGQSIYERKRPLSEKTMRRIMAGLEKFGLGPFIVPKETGEGRVRDVDKPLHTVTAGCRSIALVQPFLIDGFGEREGQAPRVRSVDAPLPTVTAQKGGPCLVQPFIIPQQSNPTPKSVEEPLGTLCAEGSGPKLVQPFLVPLRHDNAAEDVNKPLSTVCTATHHGLAQPMLIKVAGAEDRPARSVDQPMPTVTAGGVQHGIAQPFLIAMEHGGRVDSIDKPLRTVTCAKGGAIAVAQPFLVETAHGGERRPRSVEEPMSTVAGNRGGTALVTPALLPQNAGGALRPIDQPAPTIACDGAVALVEPFLVEYYGNSDAQSVGTPLNTVTTKDRHALVRPVVVIDGERYLLDIRFRMLQPRELAAAQGFRRDYKFTGNKSEQVKQIGNAVPRRLARALCLAALSQQSNIADLLREEDAA